MRIGPFELKEPLPKLRDPHVIASLHPWIDAGNVGTTCLNRLEAYFAAEELGRLAKPGMFFDFTRYRPVTQLLDGQRTFTLPNTVISVAKRDKPPDLVFCRTLEPHADAEDYVEGLTELFKALKVKRHCRVGSMWDAVPHTRPLLITGVQNNKPLTGIKGLTTRRWAPYQGPTTILGILNQELEKLGVDSVALIVHLPQYLQLEEDLAGTARLLEVLAALYQLPEGIAQNELGEQQYRSLSAELENNPEAKRLIRRLEANYEARTTPGEETREEPSRLAPEVQQFLQDLGKRLDDL
ncbi:MAG: PAC2 family protein [Dehalococcoidia bacterium]|nr:PAC2 family protein [Dehalococcoidia bacterium]